ncbi:MAG: hypothetical protein HC781_07380 [Leptolyngbyaceae cyanobacterium CSU_1_4]|nr:hypothetical protein [Leptolyngbyaceae cyanobacterium CSU_1_4]
MFLPGSTPDFQQQVLRLHQLTVYSRWLLVAFLWLFIAPLCLWHLRSEIELWIEYFTWTAVRYTIIYNRLASFGLALCVAWTMSVLLWQSRNIVRGIPAEERRSLEKQVLRIRQQGKSHPLWNWVCKP